MERKCPRCKTLNAEVAKFCAQCGLSLTAGPDGQLAPGRVRHPQPLAPPDGMLPCVGAEHLHYRWGPVWGESFLLGTEGIAVTLFNGAYPLENAVFEVRGHDAGGTERFAVKQTVEVLPVGREVRMEIPSYELPGPVRELSIRLVSADFSSSP